MEELNWPVACHLNAASSLILPGGRKPDQQRSFILSVWKLARGPLLFTCVCVCVLLGEMAPRGHLGANATAFLGMVSVHLLHVRSHSLLAMPVQCYHVEGRSFLSPQ